MILSLITNNECVGAIGAAGCFVGAADNNRLFDVVDSSQDGKSIRCLGRFCTQSNEVIASLASDSQMSICCSHKDFVVLRPGLYGSCVTDALNIDLIISVIGVDI